MIIFKCPDCTPENTENNKKIDELVAYFLSVDVSNPELDKAARKYIKKIQDTLKKYNS